MSGGSCGPVWDDTDCAKALQRMFVFLDHELADADAEAIQRHLDECAPCLVKYDLERTVKALVARSCAEHAPEHLRQRVMVRIEQLRIKLED